MDNFNRKAIFVILPIAGAITLYTFYSIRAFNANSYSSSRQVQSELKPETPNITIEIKDFSFDTKTDVIVGASVTLTNNSSKPLIIRGHTTVLHLNVINSQTGEFVDSAAGIDMRDIEGLDFVTIQPMEVKTLEVSSYIVHPDFEGDVYLAASLAPLTPRLINLIPSQLKAENPTAIPYEGRASSDQIPFVIKKRKSI